MAMQVCGLVAQAYGCASVFYFVGCLNGVCVLPLLSLPEIKTHKQTETRNAPGFSLAFLKSETIGLARSYRELLSCPTQRRLLVINISYFLGTSSILTLMPLHAATVWSATPAQLGPLYSLAFGLGVVGSPLGGLLSDRIGHRAVVAAAQCTSILGALAVALSSSQPEFVSGIFLFGLGMSIQTPAMEAYAADKAPGEK
eukprot:g2089.t1